MYYIRRVHCDLKLVFQPLSQKVVGSDASNLLSNGASLETVQQLLGHAELDHIMPYLNINQNKLREMFEVVL